VWDGAQVIFDLVHVVRIESPVVIAKFIEARESVSFDSSRHVYVRIEITPNEIAQAAKNRFAAMQTNVAGARN
jgi:hypothetical protein